jgi:hypothetical protein
MDMLTMLVIGKDRLSYKAINSLKYDAKSLVIVKDISTNLRRICKLIFKGTLQIDLLLKMFYCELIRKKEYTYHHDMLRVKSNQDLIRLIKVYRPDRIILFRAGLIINNDIISMRTPIMNIHCAKIPEYGGIGSINKAIKDHSYAQCATLHEVITAIDCGRILDIEPYCLDLDKPYCYNEYVAYEAGIKLLQRTVNG